MLDAKRPRCRRFAQSLQIPPCESEKPSEVKRLMSLNKITSSELRTFIAIVERKESLQEELAKIESKLSTYLSPEPITPATQSPRRTRKSRAVRVSKPPLEVKVPKQKVRQVESKSAPFSRGPKSGQRRGALKDSIGRWTATGTNTGLWGNILPT